MIIDERFYGKGKPLKLSNLIKKIKTKFPKLYHSEILNDDFFVNSFSTIEKAIENDLVFLENKKYFKYLKDCNCGCVVIAPDHLQSVNKNNSYIVTRSPRRVFAFCLGLIYPDIFEANGKNRISPNAKIKNGAVLGKNVEIGKQVIIGENTVIGDGVIIQDGTEIGSNCSINYTTIGKNCIIYPGVRIGTTGFGFNFDHDGVYKFPHRGRVVIKDNVEIGANSTIDRGSLGDTKISNFVMIDNLVHIAHNVSIGKGSVICGQSGVAGSTHIGENVTIGAQVGISGHLHIKSGTILSARSGVTKDISKAELMGGFPAMPIKEFRKQKATLSFLTRNKIRKTK